MFKQNLAHKYSQHHYSQEPKKQKQPKCPLTDEWISKMWSLHTVDYCSAMRRNEALRSLQHRRSLETPCYVKKKADTEGHILIAFIWNVQNRQTHRDRK